jgi:hypothetical protein
MNNKSNKHKIKVLYQSIQQTTHLAITIQET